MKKLILILLCLPVIVIANKQSCKQIISTTSQQFVNQYTSIHSSSALSIIKALQTYQHCYQLNTQQLENQLKQKSKGPLMGAQGNFKDFRQALNAFQSAAFKIAATGGTYDALNAAYIDLYKQKFTWSFYQSYQSAVINSINKNKLAVFKHQLANALSRFPKTKQAQIKTLFNAMNQSWVQGVNGCKSLPYEFALSILQPPEGRPLVQPML